MTRPLFWHESRPLGARFPDARVFVLGFARATAGFLPAHTLLMYAWARLAVPIEWLFRSFRW